jgi:hypothetical protein
MKSSGDRSALSRLTLVVLVAAACLLWWLSGAPSKADKVQEVVSLAAKSPEAAAAVAESLKNNPNPSVVELHALRSHVNEILVTETARQVTGDKTIETPTERDAALKRQEVKRYEMLAAKPWAEMTFDEIAEYLLISILKNWMLFLIVPLLWLFIGRLISRSLVRV